MFELNRTEPSLILVDGVKGSGKTTVANNIYEFFKDSNDLVLLYYPEINPKKILEGSNSIHPYSRFLLEEANLNQHIINFVNPCLKKGKDVICDKFSLSLLANLGQDLSPIMRSLDLNINSNIFPKHRLCQIVLSCSAQEENSNFSKYCNHLTNNYCIVDAERPTNQVTMDVKHFLGRHD